MRDFFKQKMAALLARLDRALLQQERVEVAEAAAEHWRKSAQAAEAGRVQAGKERDQLLRLRDHLEKQVIDTRRRWAGEVFGLQQHRDVMEAQRDRAHKELADQKQEVSARVAFLQHQVDCGKKDGDACEDCAVCLELRSVRLEEELSGARAAKRRWKALARKLRMVRGAQLVKDPPALPTWGVWLRPGLDPSEVPPGMAVGDPSAAQSVVAEDAESAAEAWAGEFYGDVEAMALNEAVVPVSVRAADGTVREFDVHACLVPALDAREPADEDEDGEDEDDGQ